LKKQPVVPLEAEVLSPDLIDGLTGDQVRALPVYLGKNQCRVDDFFNVEGEGCDELKIVGDVHNVKWIGRDMTRGRITIDGNAGMHLGSAMQGGEIQVSGSTSDWLGAEMTGGSIRIKGNAGGQVGGAYRGSLTGMQDGTIIIEGTAGLEVGGRMKRGTIVVVGGVRDFAGLEMRGGTIILGKADLRTGAGMIRGTIVSLKPIPILPTFLYASTYNPTFLGLYRKRLQIPGFEIPTAGQDGAYQRYTGDQAIPGKGELLVWQPRT
jgi:formylmethanofuran dehydrogenase subunit C